MRLIIVASTLPEIAAQKAERETCSAGFLLHEKGFVQPYCRIPGLGFEIRQITGHSKLMAGFEVRPSDQIILNAGEVDAAILRKFDIRQPVFFADIYWDNLIKQAAKNNIVFSELPKQMAVNRDLALIVEKSIPFARVEKAIQEIGLEKLRRVQLFDIFESEKLGIDKKSLAVSFTFLDLEKTLTDKEIDHMMSRIMKTAETELNAEIRK